MAPDEIALASVIDQVQWLRAGELSPLELTQIYLERIDQWNSRLGSYFSVKAEQAIADAVRKTDQLTAARQELSNATSLDLLPFLFGIPVSVKDLTAVKGLPHSCGVAALRDRIADRDDGIVSQIKHDGLVILGKTALSQLASWPYSEPPGFLPSRNPWNPEYTSGGSSGGAAASVAAGLCSIAQGSDGGGSIRGPAFCCGVVGIKPSRGRVSEAPAGDALGGCAVQGPLGRTVADAAALLDTMAGYLPGDPYWLQPPAEPFRVVAQRAELPTSCRIAFATELIGFPTATLDCRQAVQRVCQLLADAGGIVEEMELDVHPLVEPFKTLWLSAVSAAGVPEPLLEPMNQWLLAQAPSGVEYIQARQQLQALSRSYVQRLLPYDVLVLPTYLHPPMEVGAWCDLAPEQVMQNIMQWIAPCPLANITGQPAIALPTHLTVEGLPAGVQLMGQPGGEEQLIAIAAWLENQLQFRAQHPWPVE